MEIVGNIKNVSIVAHLAKDSHNCIVLADTTNRTTLNEIFTCKNVVDETTKLLDGGKLPCVLVENKVDLLAENEIGNDERLKSFAEQNGFIGSFRVSAKTRFNVDKSMEFLLRNVIERKK